MRPQIKKSTIAAHLLGVVVALAAVQAQAAPDGTITFTGAIQTQTCTVDAAGSLLAIQLPGVQTGAFTSAGDTAGKSLIKLHLQNCTAGQGTVRAFFEPGPTVNPTTGRLINTSKAGATAVEIGLLNKDATPIFVGQAATSKGEPIAAEVTLSYYAQYYATAVPVAAGPVTSQVTFSLDYQ